MSFPLFITSVAYPNQNPANLTVPIVPFVDLADGEWEVALVGGQITNSVPNISAALNNNTFRYSVDNGTTFYTVTLPDGIYNVTGIQNQLQSALITNGTFTVANGTNFYPINFGVNIYLLRATVQLNANAILDLSSGGFAQLCGFLQQPYVGGVNGATFTAPGNANFTNPSAYYMFYLDLIGGGGIWNQQIPTGIIRIVNGGDLGAAQSLVDPSGQYDYFPITQNKIRSLNIIVYDALGNIADFNGEETSFLFRIRAAQSSRK